MQRELEHKQYVQNLKEIIVVRDEQFIAAQNEIEERQNDRST